MLLFLKSHYQDGGFLIKPMVFEDITEFLTFLIGARSQPRFLNRGVHSVQLECSI